MGNRSSNSGFVTYWAGVGGAWDGVLALVLELTADCKATVLFSNRQVRGIVIYCSYCLIRGRL